MVVPSPNYDVMDAGGQHVSATGAFVDYYPNPRKGLHVQGGLLFALGYRLYGVDDSIRLVSPALLVSIARH